jgi:hypothetical protein
VTNFRLSLGRRATETWSPALEPPDEQPADSRCTLSYDTRFRGSRSGVRTDRGSKRKDAMTEAEIRYWEGAITDAEIDQLAGASGFYLAVEEIV